MGENYRCCSTGRTQSMIKSRGFCNVLFFRLKISKSAENLYFFPQIQHLHVDLSTTVPYMRGGAKCNHVIHVKFIVI